MELCLTLPRIHNGDLDKNNVLKPGVTFTWCPGTYAVICAIGITTCGKEVETEAVKGTFDWSQSRDAELCWEGKGVSCR